MPFVSFPTDVPSSVRKKAARLAEAALCGFSMMRELKVETLLFMALVARLPI